MENLLLKYFDSRIREPGKSEPAGTAPFVTISREFGCPSKLIAKQLADELNQLSGNNRMPFWQDINREIVEEAASKLKVDQARIRHFNAENREILYDVLSAFSTNYKSSKAIEKTTREVIRTFAHKGHVIIVGRAGAAITHGWHNSLHVRLHAPVNWRIRQVSYIKSVGEAEAAKDIAEMDKNRTSLIELYLGRKFDHTIFDVCFNCGTFSIGEVVNGIIGMMKIRGLI